MIDHIHYDEGAEAAFLGAVLIAPKHIPDFSHIRPSHFYLPANQNIWAAIRRLDHRGEKVDPITVADALDRQGKTPQEGRAYVHSLVSAAPSITHVRSYADIVRRHHLLRELGTLSQEIAAMQQANKPVEEILTHIGDALTQLEDGAISDDLVPIADALLEHWEHLEKLQSKENKTVGISTGFPKLDDLVSGLRPGAVILLAGRPGMGKTTFALSLLQHASDVEREQAHAFFSLEQPDLELNTRLLSAYTKIPSTRMQNETLTPEDWDALNRATQELSSRLIFIDDTPSLTVSDIRAKLRRLKRRQGLALAVIDYLQLLRPDRHYEDRQRELSDISRSLKLMAKELTIPIIGVAQLNRQVEARADKRPQLSDLRESGALEQDADQVIMLYRDDYYTDNSSDKGLVEVLIRKNRHGPTGTIKLAYRPDTGTFMNIPTK